MSGINEYHFSIVCGLWDNGAKIGGCFMYEFTHLCMNVCITLYICMLVCMHVCV